ncbi:MAG: ATP-dependent Clp protease proteolytic subunit [Planctomycetota bacterium]|nr:ATP-dependent Clp protease proteolytic subunit [Planctomycetota bacterium]
MPHGPLMYDQNQPTDPPALDLVRAAALQNTGIEPRAAVSYQRTREMTIDELLLENRVVFLIGEINHASAARVMMQMLYLENQKRGQDIQLYINSPGGAVDDTLAIYDTMQFISSEVATFCIGRAYSGGSVLLCAGQKGKRHILPHAKVMIHQPYGGVTGQTTDIQIQAEEIIKAKRTLNEIIARHTGQDVDRVAADGERDRFFSAAEALEYGLVDEVASFPAAKGGESSENSDK